MAAFMLLLQETRNSVVSTSEVFVIAEKRSSAAQTSAGEEPRPWLIAFLDPSTIFFPAEAQAEEPAAQTDHGPTAKPHLGDQLHVGHQELRHQRAGKGQEVTVSSPPEHARSC